MTVTLFFILFTICSSVSGLLTQAIKQVYLNAKKPYSANIIALIDSIVVGGGGTACSYILLGKQWDLNNIVCLILMCFIVWIGCMIGFDKVSQTIAQINSISALKEAEKKTK